MESQNNIYINSGEKYYQYINRVCNLKRNKLIHCTWDELAEAINESIGTAFSESYFRKRYFDESDEDTLRAHSNLQNINDFEWKIIPKEEEPTSSDEAVEDIFEKMAKEKMKLTDLRVQTNANLRRISREETIKEIAIESAKIIAKEKPIIVDQPYCGFTVNENEAILELSDWHYGIEVDNYWNKYDTNIAKERINNLLSKVLEVIEQEDIEKIHVVNLGDLICGRIHMSLRLQSRIDVITQTIEVSEILAQFIDSLVKKGHVHVDYYDCLDNHSRVEPRKTDSLELESLQRIIPWFLNERLAEHIEEQNVTIHKNMYGEDIVRFEVAGHIVGGVHGHCDAPNKIVDNLTAMTKEPFDLLLVAHYHHFSCDEKNEVVVVGNGSLMGTDEYAKNLRLTSKPSQNLIVVEPDNAISQIRRILV